MWGWLALIALLPGGGGILYKTTPPTPYLGDMNKMEADQMARRWGYPVEKHYILTADGYILETHRLPAGRLGRGRGQGPGKRVPVLIGHGLLSSSEQWLVRPDSLAFLLAELDFDVWLLNYRGSHYGRNHTTLSVKSHKFWDFSWHENGIWDQAAVIEYVLAHTKQDSVLVVGHSMSSSAQLVLMLERPEFVARTVRATVLMAPPLRHKNNRGALLLAEIVLRDLPFVQEYLRLGLNHYPQGTSFRQMWHYAQCAHDPEGRLIKYDFGASKNKRLYGSPYPPAYNFSRVSVPLYLLYSTGDSMTNYLDVEYAARKLPYLKGLYKVPAKLFNHVDFVVSQNAYELVYKKVIENLLGHV